MPQGRCPPSRGSSRKTLFGDELDDYHPPHDVRLAEHFPAEVYNAVRNSPQWERIALIVTFDEHGGT